MPQDQHPIDSWKMRSTDLFLDELLPPTSVRLGRLVLNSKAPHEDFLDPLVNRPTEAEYNVNHQKDFEETRKFSKNSKFRSYLTDILSVSYGAHDEGTTRITAPQVTTHRLENSGAWFAEACARPETREWLENATDSRKTVCLVVGLRILQDAKLARNATLATAKGVRAEVPAPTGTASVTTGPGARGILGASYDQSRVFDAPGEQIFAVQYRKVKFKWLSSRTINNTILENTRWKSCLGDWRGEGDDEEDIVEVELADASDLETPDEGYSDEDGTAPLSSHILPAASPNNAPTPQAPCAAAVHSPQSRIIPCSCGNTPPASRRASSPASKEEDSEKLKSC